MTVPLGEIDPDRFLREHWQREPLLIRNAFPDLKFPLDANDLAGLACENLAEARIVEGPGDDGDWRLRHGPFDEAVFEDIGDHDWTLLVQDVEKHYPPLRAFLNAFDFLPTWRLDDLMLSFAAPGGSVGPHVDQYDVFLLQVEGHRRWQIARRFDSAAREDVPLDMLAAFEPEHEWVLGPGDMLYLPPGVAHHGVAVDACLTASVGFRAPSAADLAMGFGEWLARQPGDGGRYADPGLPTPGAAGEIDEAARTRLRDLLIDALRDDTAFAEFAGAFLSRFRQAHEPVPPPGGTANADIPDTTRREVLQPHPWARMNWIRRDASAVLFASGRRYTCSVELAQWLCAGAGQVPALNDDDRTCLRALINDGQLLFSPTD